MDDKLSESFKKDLIANSLDLGMDYSELFVDELIENEVIKEIPIVKTFVSGIKIFSSIREKFNLKKYLVFLEHFHKGEIEEANYVEFKDRINADKKYHDEILEKTMLIIDRLDEIRKLKILGRIFVKYVNKEIDWNYFQTLSACLERMNVKCILILTNYSTRNWMNTVTNRNNIDMEDQCLMTSSGLAMNHGSHFVINKFGKDIYAFGIE
jgi:hypothetical protein